MNSMVGRWTSTGGKFIHHPEVVKLVMNEKKALPISLQVAPTSRCNLNCVFCSNTNREVHEDIDFDEMLSVIYGLESLGLKTIEWTGGGDPLMYSSIRDIVDFCHDVGLKQGLITNGLLLWEYNLEWLNKFDWIRVSMNSLDYVNKFSIPNISGILGFSYVMNEKTTTTTLYQLKKYTDRHNPEYVRIVPNCQSTFAEQERNNKLLSERVSKWGRPFFYQAKKFETPKNCWWCYFKPFLLHDGYVYPCSSVVLNDQADQQFHDKYRWVKATLLKRKYDYEMVPFETGQCNKCVFQPQNDLIESLVNPNGMEMFV